MRRMVSGVAIACLLATGAPVQAQDPRRAVDDDTAFWLETGGGMLGYSLPAAMVVYGLSAGGVGAGLDGDAGWFGVLMGPGE